MIANHTISGKSRGLCNRAVQTATARREGIADVTSKKLPAVLLAGALLGGTLCYQAPSYAESSTSLAASDSTEKVQPIYFGNGCFWGRQKDFVDAEAAMGRDPFSVSAVTGYAGGTKSTSDGRVCYYYAYDDSVYEKLGHAEVVKLDLRGQSKEAEDQMRMFARTYFSQFQKSPFGMMRSDPQDVGSGYRNVIGLPGGINSPYMKVIKEENINKMKLVPGSGDEEDKINVIYVLDSDKFPFYRAENYHQFHNGLGKQFPKAYTRDQKKAALEAGVIDETGCPEFGFMSSG